jgi:hypothetical protein
MSILQRSSIFVLPCNLPWILLHTKPILSKFTNHGAARFYLATPPQQPGLPKPGLPNRIIPILRLLPGKVAADVSPQVPVDGNAQSFGTRIPGISVRNTEWEDESTVSFPSNWTHHAPHCQSRTLVEVTHHASLCRTSTPSRRPQNHPRNAKKVEFWKFFVPNAEIFEGSRKKFGDCWNVEYSSCSFVDFPSITHQPTCRFVSPFLLSSFLVNHLLILPLRLCPCHIFSEVKLSNAPFCGLNWRAAWARAMQACFTTENVLFGSIYEVQVIEHVRQLPKNSLDTWKPYPCPQTEPYRLIFDRYSKNQVFLKQMIYRGSTYNFGYQFQSERGDYIQKNLCR